MLVNGHQILSISLLQGCSFWSSKRNQQLYAEQNSLFMVVKEINKSLPKRDVVLISFGSSSRGGNAFWEYGNGCGGGFISQFSPLYCNRI